MKRKILYLMHIDWGWIKQRPHFIAEKLEMDFDVSVFYMFSRKRKLMTSNPSDINKYPIITFPLKRINILNTLNIIVQKVFFSAILKIMKPDFIWITYPELYDYLPKKNLKKYKIIYDCMDDVQGFKYNSNIKARLDISERKLLRDSDIVFASSENLRKKIIIRGCNSDKAVIVRNGYNGEIIEAFPNKSSAHKKFKVAYIGTVSEWVDFDILQKSLAEISNVEYHFYGPIECELPKNEKVFFHGPIKHSLLYETIRDYDSLIMPFKINELILSVDPVKLYEYINFNKNIITIYYKEIERFKDYVYFYNNTQEYIDVLKRLIQNNDLKYSKEQRYKFLIENSWDKRTEVVLKKLRNFNEI